ncbi:hypothetical protein PVAP13_5KG761800 [Panicum virgatum]|uniref:Uncharacterized protein n=1 Tax=Panicum virgatum TaxID=38727 RepID=A0A8T0T1V3_PANVG|nr:hypothetical protein PVAP13_5KG761800 [Panicum virgatum]
MSRRFHLPLASPPHPCRPFQVSVLRGGRRGDPRGPAAPCSSSTTPRHPAVASTSASMRTSPYEAGSEGSEGVFHRWSRRSGLTMACAGQLFDGMALKRHKYTKIFVKGTIMFY